MFLYFIIFLPSECVFKYGDAKKIWVSFKIVYITVVEERGAFYFLICSFIYEIF